jgi:uncharacterized alkaline shock family protein YloU
MDEMINAQQREDKIKISEDVIATIAGIAASENENLASMSGGFVDGIAGMLGRKSPSKGIKVEIRDNTATIDMSVVMQYGCKIHEVSRDMQKRVRQAVETMTGMVVTSVNVNVLGISLGKETGKLEVVDETTNQV